MLTLKCQKNIKCVLLILVALFVILTEPVSADRASRGGGKSNGGGGQSKQVQRDSGGGRNRAPAGVGKSVGTKKTAPSVSSARLLVGTRL